MSIRLRYSLQALLLLVIVVSPVLTWVGKLYRDHRLEREAAELIVQRRGFYDVEDDYSAWRGWLGLPQNTISELIFLNDFEADGFDEKLIARFPNLKTLRLSHTSFDGSELKYVQNPESIQQIRLTRSSVNDSTLRYVSRFKNLKRLDLNDVKIHGKGFRHLKELRSLEDLRIESDIHDSSIAHLSQLPRLEKLMIFSGRLSDNGIRHLKSSKSLKVLEVFGGLDSGLITENCIDDLADIENLQHMEIDTSGFSVEGLYELKKLQHLDSLHLRLLPEHVTSQHCQELKSLIPNAYSRRL